MKITITTLEYEIKLDLDNGLVKDTHKFVKKLPDALHEPTLCKAALRYDTNEGGNEDLNIKLIMQSALNYMVVFIPNYKRKHVKFSVYEHHVDFDLV